MAATCQKRIVHLYTVGEGVTCPPPVSGLLKVIKS